MRRDWVRNSGSVDEFFPQVAHFAEAGTFDVPEEAASAASAASAGPAAAATAVLASGARADVPVEVEPQPEPPRRKRCRADPDGRVADEQSGGDTERAGAVTFGSGIGVSIDDKGRVRCDNATGSGEACGELR